MKRRKAMANAKYDFNLVKNWGLRCYEMKMTEKMVVLKCSMSRKNKETGEYTAPIYIDVNCMFDSCEIEQDDYAKSNINVDGQFAVNEYTNKNGDKVPQMMIWATKVTKSESRGKK